MQTETLETRVNRWKWGIASLGAVLVATYLGYFGLYLQHPPALDADKWGQFGDFFGGILNPLVAFAAFYWLTQSVKIQHTELADTRIALQQSSAAQGIQAKNSDIQLAIAARTGLVNALQPSIDSLESLLRSDEQKIQNLTAALIPKTFGPGEVLKLHMVSHAAMRTRKANEKELETLQEKRVFMLEDLLRKTEERDQYLIELRQILGSINAVVHPAKVGE